MFSWLTRWFGSARPSAEAAQAHITFGNTSVGRSISRTRLFLQKQLWIWPIIAVVLLAAIGFGIRSAIERTMKENLRSELQTLLSVEQSMLETWLKVQEANAESAVWRPRFSRLLIRRSTRRHPRLRMCQLRAPSPRR
jgi:nitrate reductase NapE component